MIEHVIETATMKHDGFGKDNDMPNDKYTNEIREATKLWRETWIIAPLKEILAKVKQ